MSRFVRVSDNTCCHGNPLNTFGLKILNLERGDIISSPNLQSLFMTENMSVKNYGTHLKKQHGRHS